MKQYSTVRVAFQLLCLLFIHTNLLSVESQKSGRSDYEHSIQPEKSSYNKQSSLARRMFRSLIKKNKRAISIIGVIAVILVVRMIWLSVYKNEPSNDGETGIGELLDDHDKNRNDDMRHVHDEHGNGDVIDHDGSRDKRSSAYHGNRNEDMGNGYDEDGNGDVIDHDENRDNSMNDLYPKINVNYKLGNYPLIDAVCNQDEKTVNILIDEYNIDVNSMELGSWRNLKETGGCSPLMAIAEKNNVKIMKKLLQQGSINVNLQDYDGNTALIYASFSGCKEAIMVLLKYPDIQASLPDKKGYTPLIYAVRQNHPDIIDLLCDVMDVNSSDNKGWTALMHGVSQNSYNAVKQVLKRKGINVNKRSYYDGSTPLICAARLGREYMVKLLLSIPNININMTDYQYQKSALEWAKDKGHTSIVKMIQEQQKVLLANSFLTHGGG